MSFFYFFFIIGFSSYNSYAIIHPIQSAQFCGFVKYSPRVVQPSPQSTSEHFHHSP